MKTLRYLICLLLIPCFAWVGVVSSGSVTMANCKKSLVSGNAFIDIAVDLSAYAGADSGDHKYIFKLVDASGLVAWGYVGASGGGETLGSELIIASDDRDFTTWGNVNWAGTYGGTPADGTGKMQVTTDTDDSGVKLSSICVDPISVGGLYTVSADVWQGTTTITTFVYKSDNFPLRSLLFTIDGVQTAYPMNFTAEADADNTIRIMQDGNDNAKTFFIDNASIKQVTDCSTNGLHILSTKSGSVQNWAEIEAGFDYNDSYGYTYEIRTIGRGASIW